MDKLERKHRISQKNIYAINKQTDNQMFYITTNSIPLRIKALGRLLKLYANVKEYFAEDLRKFEEILGPDYWPKIIRKLAPSIAHKVNINDSWLMNTDPKLNPHARRWKKLDYMYLW